MTKAPPFAFVRREVVKPQRLVVALPAADLARIDSWGIAAGKISRSETVRALLYKSLDAEPPKKAPG